MVLMRGIRQLYRRYIYPYDPGRSALRQAIKTMAAIMVSVLLFYRVPGMVVWAALAAFAVSQAKTGESRRFRSRILLGAGGAMALLAPFATALSATSWPAILFILAIAFCAFYVNVLGPAFGRAGLFVLIVVAVALGKPGTWTTGLLRSGGIIAGTLVAFVAHFMIQLPTGLLRPQPRLQCRTGGDARA